jgi:hypothetical protein
MTSMQWRTFMKTFAFLVLITAVAYGQMPASHKAKSNSELFLVIPIREWNDAQAVRKR